MHWSSFEKSIISLHTLHLKPRSVLFSLFWGFFVVVLFVCLFVGLFFCWRKFLISKFLLKMKTMRENFMQHGLNHLMGCQICPLYTCISRYYWPNRNKLAISIICIIVLTFDHNPNTSEVISPWYPPPALGFPDTWPSHIQGV